MLQEEERRASSPLPIRSIRSSPTAGWVCRSSRWSCSLFTTSQWSPSAHLQPTGQTTACSATAGTCSASALPITTTQTTNTRGAIQAVSAFLGEDVDVEADDFDADALLADMKAFQTDRQRQQPSMSRMRRPSRSTTMTAYYDALPEGADEDGRRCPDDLCRRGGLP